MKEKENLHPEMEKYLGMFGSGKEFEQIKRQSDKYTHIRHKEKIKNFLANILIISLGLAFVAGIMFLALKPLL